jgi:hypothetical protein
MALKNYIYVSKRVEATDCLKVTTIFYVCQRYMLSTGWTT